MAQNDPLREALEIFGTEYINELTAQLRKSDKNASGNLIRSLETKIIKTGFGTEYTLEIRGADYLEFVDRGRKPGKQPPLRAIQKWTKIKGINPKAAYPIARSIGENGIKATNVIANSLRKVNKGRALRVLEEGYFDWVDQMVDKMILNISKNNNITVSKQ
jgi:hypothetical protein